MKKIALLILIISYATIGFSQKGKIGRYGVKNLFTLDIYFPPNYDSLKSHKVVYLNDGESIFGFKPVFDSLINNGITSEFMVVGIHAGEKRTDKYLPYTDQWIMKNWGEYNPFAAAYSEVVMKGIVPFVEDNFNVISSKDGRAVFGYSFGGLHATWMGLKYSDEFSVIGAFSPSYWVANFQLIKEQSKFRNDQKFWFDIGTAEWNYYIPMLETLDTLGWELGKDLFYYEVPKAKHEFNAWKQRVAYPLILFVGKNQNLDEIKKLELYNHCIPSQSNPGTIYKRLNPIVTLKNGLKYSPVGQVNFKVTKGKAEINEDGSFISNDNFKVSYQYKGFSGEKKVRCD
ncbi:MAG: alpha/beta hydrolase-fold protein [bacterium]|nr:alpha/beta hydrolase-fold protein [bacterium]